MNNIEFLSKIMKHFPCTEEEDVIEERLYMYSVMLSDIESRREQKINYEETLKCFINSYPYKGFPNFTEINKCIKFFPRQHDEIETPKRYLVKEFGHYYIFEQVPPYFKGAHSLSDFSDVTEIDENSPYL